VAGIVEEGFLTLPLHSQEDQGHRKEEAKRQDGIPRGEGSLKGRR
jgi:hypothetical protein